MSTRHSSIICGIDIGNSAVKTIIAEVDRQSLVTRLAGIGTVESRGLRRGMVVDMNETIANIAQSIRQAENMAGIKINRAYVSLSGPHIKTQTSRGVIAVSRADNQISQSDIDRVIEAASVISLPANREMIHVLPRNYTIDGQEQVKNPMGMKGVRLEAEVYIIEGLSTHIHNIAQCVNANNIEVIDFVYAPMAVSLAALDRQQREYGVLNLDFGGGTSAFALFHEGDLVHTGVLPVGSRHITNDLAVALKTSMDVAEKVKRDHGTLELASLTKKDTVDLSEVLGEENYILPRRELAKIIEARVTELFDMVSAELQRVPRQYLLPGGLVLIGGGSNLVGLANFAKDRLKLPVKIANSYYLNGGSSERIADPAFAVAAGLIAWGFDKEFGHGSPSIRIPGREFISSNNTLKKALSWLRNFLP